MTVLLVGGIPVLSGGLIVASASATIPTTPQTTMVHNGETATLSGTMEVGTYADGSPFVIGEPGKTLTAFSTPASDIQSDGAVGNGAMINPAVLDTDQRQGFDGYLADYPPKTTYQTPYDATLNADPAINGAISLDVSAGQKKSIVKTIRAAGKTSNSAQFQTIEKYAVFTVVSEAPLVGSVRPGLSGTSEATRQVPGFTPRNIAKPGSWDTVATILSEMPDLPINFVSKADSQRFFRTDDALGITSDGYSGGFVDEYAKFLYLLNTSDVNSAQRDEILARVLVYANDVENAYDAGIVFDSGAGQGGGAWLWVMAAAILLNDATLLSKARTMGLQIDQSPNWVTSASVGFPAPAEVNVNGQTYFPEHVDTPWVTPSMNASNHSASYVEIAAKIVGWEVLSILAFDQGVGAYSNGAETILEGGANDQTNDKAAPLAFCSRWETFVPNSSSSSAYDVPQTWLDAWADMKATGDFTAWVGQPDQPPLGSDSQFAGYFTGGDGQVTLDDPANFDYATEAVTRRDMQYSLDGVQWITTSDIGALPYVKTGLLKSTSHYCRWRHASASGNSPWSPNFPQFVGGGDRDVVSTTGTDTATAPDWTGGTQPTIHYRPYPAWEHPFWEEASGTLALNDIELACGKGYFGSCYPAPTYTFQWKRDGVNISGATSQTYTRTAADAGTVLTCEITATNASGSDTVTTAGVTCPALTTLPAGTIIDTDFKGAFAIDYESELAALNPNGAVVTHEPGAGFPRSEGYNPGALEIDKSGQYPGIDMDMSRALVAGTTYRVEVEVVSTRDQAWAGPLRLGLRRQSDNTFYEAAQSIAVDEAYMVVTADFQVAIGGGEANLDASFFLEHQTNTGGVGGGSPWLTRLKISAV